MTQTESTNFLYPFIDSEERDSSSLLTDLAASATAKVHESSAMQQATLAEFGERIEEAAEQMAERFTDRGRMYAFGNGGSSTDAATFAALFARPITGRALPAVNLAADMSVITALGNDVGFELVFSRQIIAHSSGHDVAVAFSTSGNSADLMAALREAKHRGLLTIGLAGYTGGEMAESDAVDFCFVVRSQSIHRIQESQALLGYQLWSAVQRKLASRAEGTAGHRAEAKA
ncbi:MAG: D-sedoheptulose-7-phosphate isomerase [Acidothermaceae bacterium]